jgi:hypothetical protein
MTRFYNVDLSTSGRQVSVQESAIQRRNVEECRDFATCHVCIVRAETLDEALRKSRRKHPTR